MINADAGTIDVLDFSDPANPTRTTQLDPVTDVGGTVDGVNSVAVSSNGIVAAALEDATATNDGRVAFYSVDPASGGITFEGSASAGPLPDMVAFTPDGNTLLVANEGEVPEDSGNDELRDFAADVPGSISVIDLSGGVGSASETRLGFADFNSGGVRAGELPDGVRINPNASSVANDLEPEFITVAEDGSRAVVSLQENNALAEIDLSGAGASIARIVALGTKDHGLGFNAMDASDDDGTCTAMDPACINIKARANVAGLYMPDGIDTFMADGSTYVVTANEGDGRGEDTDECAIKDDAGGSLNLDANVFPMSVQADAELGELTVSCDDINQDQAFAGDTDADGNIEQLLSFGGRSLSVVELGTGVIGDTGDGFERITAHLDRFGSTPFTFNDDNDDDSPERDTRSDAKGPEPEGVVTTTLSGRTYAFVGLERVGGIMMYDVTNPRLPRFVDYINNRDFTVDGADLESGAVGLDQAGDWGPEGLVFIAAADSPNGQDLLVVGNEVTGTTTVYSVSAP
ncbi:MAG: choice-of-anchor I family protein [Halofilum sp. (in: g-proteobacteria)]|nr:choice-of-anchor I family protein [Halofilum sp. (in: g-proteobacteria)]